MARPREETGESERKHEDSRGKTAGPGKLPFDRRVCATDSQDGMQEKELAQIRVVIFVLSRG